MQSNQKCCKNPDCPMDNPQPLENFWKLKTSPDGLAYRCITCRKIQKKESDKRHPETKKKYREKWNRENPEKAKKSKQKADYKYKNLNRDSINKRRRIRRNNKRDEKMFLDMLQVTETLKKGEENGNGNRNNQLSS